LITLLSNFQILDAQSKTQTKNVILITLDGFRWQELFKGADHEILASPKFIKGKQKAVQFESYEDQRENLMPFFWNTIATQGQLYGNRKIKSFVNCANPYWFSYPGYHEMLVGSVNRSVCSNRKVINPNTTVFDFVNELPDFKNNIKAFTTWDVFPYILRESINGISVNSGVEFVTGECLSADELKLNEDQKDKRNDSITFHLAFEDLKRNRTRMLFISLDETDEYSHRGHYDQYLLAAHKADQWISNLWTWLQSQPDYKDHTTLIISTDHGRGRSERKNWRNHGRLTFGSDEIWMAVIGPDTPALGEMRGDQIYQKQLAKTLAAFLGENYQNKFSVGEIIHTMIRPMALIANVEKQEVEMREKE
jgi:hypothetical protein